jgi:hypothetical protein
MSATPMPAPMEDQIAQWRQFLRRRRAIESADIEELEDHLRSQVTLLSDAGLAGDEAFLVAVKRMGSLDELSREFAREHSERLWKQLVIGDGDSPTAQAMLRSDAFVALGLAVAAALSMKAPALFGHEFTEQSTFYPRNASLLILPHLAGYFAWKRGLGVMRTLLLVLPFAVGAVFANIYPFAGPRSNTAMLTALHLPIALWLAVGVSYAAGHWFRGNTRMDFVRFSGELFIYYVLLALGGGVFIMFTILMFNAIGVNAELLVQKWLLPCGIAGALLVGSWLVEAKQSVIENMAPVLTRVFTPFFTILLLAFLATMAWTGKPIDVQRNVLIAFDLLLVLVVGLVLYAASARDLSAPPNLFDRLQLLLILSALLVDILALAAIAARISEFGFTPNRVAALGENIILLVNLVWSAVVYARFLTGRSSFAALERWQTAYLPIYSAWAAFVVVAFPPLFSFI